MKTRLRLLLFISLMSVSIAMRAENFGAQTIVYDIYYHCAFIEERAAEATVQISDYDGTYVATMGGKSIPIRGTIYCINDTLQARFSPAESEGSPATENIMYIQGYYRKPHVNQASDPYSTLSFRNILGDGELSASHTTMECVNLTADMLCMFYYAKTINFDQMAKDVAIDVPIRMPYGEERTLQLVNKGTTVFNGRDVYELQANFTYGPGLSQYPITVLIDTNTQVPLRFSASIDIGHVCMDYRY